MQSINYKQTNIILPISSRTPDMTDPCKQTALKSMNSTVSSPSLKRKRPPRIEIPMILREIAADSKPKSRECQAKADAGAGTGCFSGFGVGVVSVKGKKSFMEDTHKIVSSSHGNKGFFGVYDGHGGSKAAEFVAENLHTKIFEMLENCSGNTTKEEAIKAGFLKTDDEFLKQGLGSGACCVTALIEGNELVISNIGDCRAVLCKGGKAEALTIDHRAGNEDERRRIENKGGYVVNHRGAWRVHGILSVSRSIGDTHLKDWVVAEPETKILQLTTDMDYVVLASDGLWEEVGNQESIDVVVRSCAAEKSLGLGENATKENENEDEHGRLMSSSPKIRRFSLVKPKGQNGQSPRTQILTDQENKQKDIGSEIEIPPSKARRISMVNQVKKRGQNSDQENVGCMNTAASDKLIVACKELVKLAVKKGSLDDITVMIIDLNQYKK